jgi:hypothetical protein
VKQQKTLNPNPFFVVCAKLLASRPITFLLDPFIPRLLTSFLSENLEKWKTKGWLKSYRFKVERIRRLTYKVEVHVLVSEQETKQKLIEYISQLLAPALKK